MNNKSIFFAMLAACAPLHTRLTVVQQAKGHPLASAQCKVKLAPIGFSELRVGVQSEHDWLAARNDKQKAAYAIDKSESAQRYESAINATIGDMIGDNDTCFVARTMLTHWEPELQGDAFGSSATARVVITDSRTDAVVDIVEMHARVAGLVDPSTGGRMRQASKKLADLLANYLKQRAAQDE